AEPHERARCRVADQVLRVPDVELATVQERDRVGVEYDDGHAGSGEIGVAARLHVGQKCLQILVRVPDVEGEALQVVDGLDRLQALRTGELLEGGTTRRLRLIDSLRFGHVTSSASGLQVCQVHATLPRDSARGMDAGWSLCERSEPKSCAPPLTSTKLVEAATGIEPVYRALQNVPAGLQRTSAGRNRRSRPMRGPSRTAADGCVRAIHARWFMLGRKPAVGIRAEATHSQATDD